LIKSLIYKIREYKNFHNFLQVEMDEIEKKMSKIKNRGMLKKKIFNISIFFQKNF